MTGLSLDVGLGSTSIIGAVEAAIEDDLAAILLGAGASAIYLPKKAGQLFSDTAGTVAVAPASGGAVAHLNDYSGNGYDLLQSVAGEQPLASGGVDFDGVDDQLEAAWAGSADVTVVLGIVTTDVKAMIMRDASKFIACTDATTSSTHSSAGSPTVLVDDAAIANQRVVLRDAVNDGAAHRLEYRNMDASAWASIQLADGNFSGFEYDGAVVAMVVIDNAVLTAGEATDALALAQSLIDGQNAL